MLDTLPSATLARVTAVVTRVLARTGRAATVAAGEPLVDAGLTSVDMVGLMLAVEAEFDLTIPPEDITPPNFRSIATVTALMERLRPAG